VRIGSLFSGCDGLALGVQRAIGGTVTWHSEVDPAACKVLAHRWPDTPNHGDITSIDWAQVEPVDVACAGFPCQPVSNAGKRLGTADERWLFDEIVRAIGGLASRPRLLVLENVPGLLTANRGDAMARVVQGLASVGYVGRYRVVRASDAGAAHGRARVFIVAHPDGQGLEGSEPAGRRLLSARGAAADTDTLGRERGRSARGRWPGPADGLLPTPRATDGTGGHLTRSGDRSGELLLPGVAKSLAMLGGGNPNTTGSHGTTLTDATVRQPDRWGVYAAAIHRWEQVLGRPAPDPAETGPKGRPRLSCRFDEWLMGLPAGWVTDVPGVSHNDALRLCGNGCVPQQVALALSLLLGCEVAA